MNKICPEDKGGSFNEKLYNDYLDAIINYTKWIGQVSKKELSK